CPVANSLSWIKLFLETKTSGLMAYFKIKQTRFIVVRINGFSQKITTNLNLNYSFAQAFVT
ncbi:MAG: hypothetical protein ACYCYC_14020, partial [Bellilinea sp.]